MRKTYKKIYHTILCFTNKYKKSIMRGCVSFFIETFFNNHIIAMIKKAYALCALFGACATFGAGFQVLEQGASNLGSALAGSTVNANADASSAFWNPSASFAMDLRPGDTVMDSGMNFVVPSFSFSGKGYAMGQEVSGSDGGNAGVTSYVPNFYLVHQFTENLLGTFAVTSPYGLETNYENDWVGRYQALNSDLVTVDINPSIAYKVTDWLTIGGGVSLQYLHAELTQATPIAPGRDATVSLRGQSWGVGGNVGFTIKYAEGGRLGFNWRSEVSQDIKGNQHLEMGMTDIIMNPIDTNIVLPQTFNVGIYQRLRGALDRFAVMADYSFTCWNSFNELDIKNSDTGQTVGGEAVHENWKNVSRVSVGLHYYPEFDENLVLRIGATWDESPVVGPKNRTARIPCADRAWLAGGLGYSYKNMTFNISYMYIFFYNDSGIDHTTSNGAYQTIGKYTGHAQVVSIQAGISF